METIQIRIPAPTLDNKLRQERAALALKLQTKIANEERIADYLGRKPKVDNHPLLDRFVKGIDIAYKTQLNIRAMQNILATVQRNQPIAQMDRVKRVQQLSIMYRNGIIRPKKHCITKTIAGLPMGTQISGPTMGFNFSQKYIQPLCRFSTTLLQRHCLQHYQY